MSALDFRFWRLPLLCRDGLFNNGTVRSATVYVLAILCSGVFSSAETLTQ